MQPLKANLFRSTLPQLRSALRRVMDLYMGLFQFFIYLFFDPKYIAVTLFFCVICLKIKSGLFKSTFPTIACVLITKSEVHVDR